MRYFATQQKRWRFHCLGCVTHEPDRGRKAKEENKDLWISKAGFLPSCFCLPAWCPKRAMHIPRFVGILFLFRSSVSSKHFTVNGVNTSKSIVKSLCLCLATVMIIISIFHFCKPVICRSESALQIFEASSEGSEY